MTGLSRRGFIMGASCTIASAYAGVWLDPAEKPVIHYDVANGRGEFEHHTLHYWSMEFRGTVWDYGIAVDQDSPLFDVDAHHKYVAQIFERVLWQS